MIYVKLWILAVALLAVAQTSPSPAPTSTAPVYIGNPAIRMKLSLRPLGFDADGNADWLVVTRFFDAQSRPTRIMANSNFNWTSRDGYVLWQARLRYGQPSAIVKTVRDGPLTLTVQAVKPQLGTLIVRTDTRRWRGARVVARPLGPHLVAVGWFPQEEQLARLARVDADGQRRLVAVIAGRSSTYRDTSVLPGRSYRYILYRPDHAPVELAAVTTFAEPPATVVANASGKAMWLFFTTNPVDDIYYEHLDPRAIADQAARAGLHYVELRLTYGAFWEVSPGSRPTIDAIVDALAARGIGTIAWAVPRDTTAEDVAATTRAAYYRTAKGTPMAGLALDIERGDEFMGQAPQGLSALWEYVRAVRQAMGPKYLIVTTVEDPYLEHLDDKAYPYVQIARYSDVLQPMAYWRMFRPKSMNPQQVEKIMASSYETLLAQSRRTIPISMGGQTSGESRIGNPPGNEITASLEASKRIGAIGVCYFAWDGTQQDQWNALASYAW